MDYNATTPLDRDVLTAIHNALKSAWGNPSSSHQAGNSLVYMRCLYAINLQDSFVCIQLTVDRYKTDDKYKVNFKK